MANKFCELLNIKYPIIQGAMARIANASLAGAVSKAGGLGVIAAGTSTPDEVREEIRKIKIMTDNPFCVNIMLLSSYADDIARLIIEENVPVVTTGAGNPGTYMDEFKSKGIKVIPVIPSVALAKRMEKFGADAIVAEGMEAGGHIGKLTTMALLPQVADAVSIPVIGAGGIGDGRGMAAAFILGASGVQIGTRFLLANECTVHQNYKNSIIKMKDIDTTITGTLTGHPVRVMRNKLSKQFDELEKNEAKKDEPNLKAFDELGIGGLKKAVIDGDVEYGSVMAGQIAGLVNKEQSCEEIILEIMGEFNKLTRS